MRGLSREMERLFEEVLRESESYRPRRRIREALDDDTIQELEGILEECINGEIGPVSAAFSIGKKFFVPAKEDALLRDKLISHINRYQYRHDPRNDIWVKFRKNLEPFIRGRPR